MIKTLYKTFQRWSEKGSVYIISDTHFEDSDCHYMDPDWPTPEEYCENVWKGLSKNDTLICLGDVGNPKYFLPLKCHKVLIMGNHDEARTKFEPYFDEIYEGPLMIAEKIILSHEKLDINWAFNIHGHDHNTCSIDDDYHLNCAANVIGYKKINLAKLIKSGVLSKVTSLHRQTINNATNALEE